MQVAHFGHVQHRHHHGPLLGGQWRAGQRHRHLLATAGAQEGIVQAPGFVQAVSGVHLRVRPGRYVGLLQETQEFLALQLIDLGVEQA